MSIAAAPKPLSYDAFISYSRSDQEFAARLEKALESYKAPRDLAAPQRPLNVFRDEGDLTGTEYFQSIEEHLANSGKLIVLCSPAARQSRYVGDEIRRFAGLMGPKSIIPVLIGGLPNNEARPDQESEKAFPDALCEVMEMPLAVDYLRFDPRVSKINKGEFEGSWYTLLADLFGLSRREVERRDRKRQIHQRRVRAAIVSVVILALSAGLIVSLVFWRQAVEQARIALGRQLAAQAQLMKGQRPELAVHSALLAAESVRLLGSRTSVEADDVLRYWLTLLPRVRYRSPGGAIVKAVAFSPDGRVLATGSEDRFMRLWDLGSGQRLAEFPQDSIVSGIAFASDGNELIVASGTAVNIYNAADRTRLARLEQEKAINAMAISRQPQFVATGSYGGAATVWDVASRKEVFRTKHGGNVTAVALSATGRLLATTSVDARVWDLTTGKNIARFDQADASEAVAFSPDERYLATGSADGTVQLWELSSGHEIASFAHEEGITGLAFSADGKRLATGTIRGVARIWDMDRRRESARMIHDGTIHAVAFTVDGELVATASEDGTARVWQTDARGGVDRVVVADRIAAIAFSREISRLIVASARGDVTDVRDWHQHTLTTRIDHTIPGAPTALSLNAQGTQLAAATRDGSVQIWETDRSKEVARLHAGGTASAATFSSDGRYVAAASGHQTIVWETATGKEVARFTHQGTVEALALSPDDQTLVTATNDSRVQFWDMRTGRVTGEIKHEDGALAVSYSPDGRYLATAGWSGDARVWDIATKRDVAALRHEEYATAVAFSLDGRYIGTTSDDGTARVWEVGSFREIARMTHDGAPPHGPAFSADNRYLATVSGDSAYVWPLRPNDLIAEMCLRMPRNLSRSEWAHYLGAGQDYRQTCVNLPAVP